MLSSNRRTRATLIIALAFLHPAGAAVAATTSPGPASPSKSGNAAKSPSDTTAAKGDSKAPVQVTFGVLPATGDKPDARPAFGYGATPGGQLQDKVAVKNYSATPLQLRVYATDTTTSTKGQFELLPSATKPRVIGAWIKLDMRTSVITLPPNSYTVIPFRLTIPKDAPPGDHTGAILASLDTIGNDKTGLKVKLEQRVGSRVAVRVTGPLHPRLSVTEFHASYKSNSVQPSARGHVAVSYIVKNTGNVRLGAKETLRISGLIGGGTSAPVPDVPELLPGDSFPVSTVVRDVLPGIRLTVRTKMTAIPHPGDVNPAMGPIRHSAGLWAVPWLLLLLIVLIVTGIGWRLVRRRRRRNADLAQVGASPVASRSNVLKTSATESA